VKIYFAGSVSAGRQDVESYKELINYIKNHGDVLTEHVGDSSMNELGEDKPPEFIHERDMSWLAESDVLIAEVSNPSLGVGFEIARAIENKMNVL